MAGARAGVEIFPDNLLYCSPEKYVLKFAPGVLPTQLTQCTVDYQFSDGSVRSGIFVDVLAPNVLLVYHPALKSPGKFVATLHPVGNKVKEYARYTLRTLSPMEYVYKKLCTPSSHNQSSLFSVEPKTMQAFFAALLAYYSNIESDSDYINTDLMFYNLLYHFDISCGEEKHWNVAAIMAGIFGATENLLHFTLRRQYESSSDYLVNIFLKKYEWIFFEKARNGDTAVDLANKTGLKKLETQIRQKMIGLKPYEDITTTPRSTMENGNNSSDYQPLVFSIPTVAVKNTFPKEDLMDDSQVDFIRTLKKCTVSKATVVSEYIPKGEIGCIPLKKGELVHIVKHHEHGWCFGLATDKYGYFPASVVDTEDKKRYSNLRYDSALRSPPLSSKIPIMTLDESSTTNIPSVEALKTQSLYLAKVTEFYKVSLSSPTVELKVGEIVHVVEDIDPHWCRAIYKSFVCLLPRTILTKYVEDVYEVVDTTNGTPVIQRNTKKASSSKKKKQAEKPLKDNDVVNTDNTTTSPSVQALVGSPGVKRMVRRKAPPPPVNKLSDTSLNNSNDQKPSHNLSNTSNVAVTENDQKALGSPELVTTVKESDEKHSVAETPKPKSFKKSVSYGDIPNVPKSPKIPPPLPLRESSLTSESLSVDKDDQSVHSELKQNKTAKPVPKRRTKSVYHH